MTATTQMKLLITPTPQGIEWEMRDDERRIGHGQEVSGDWQAVRGVELRSGIYLVKLCGPCVDDAAREVAKRYGWEVES